MFNFAEKALTVNLQSKLLFKTSIKALLSLEVQIYLTQMLPLNSQELIK